MATILSIAAHTAHQYESLGQGRHALKSLQQTACMLGIDLLKFFLMGRLGKTCVMDNVAKRSFCGQRERNLRKLLRHLIHRVEINFQEMDRQPLEALSCTLFAYCHPYVKPQFYSFFQDVFADKTCCSCNQKPLFVLPLFLQVHFLFRIKKATQTRPNRPPLSDTINRYS